MCICVSECANVPPGSPFAGARASHICGEADTSTACKHPVSYKEDGHSHLVCGVCRLCCRYYTWWCEEPHFLPVADGEGIAPGAQRQREKKATGGVKKGARKRRHKRGGGTRLVPEEALLGRDAPRRGRRGTTEGDAVLTSAVSNLHNPYTPKNTHFEELSKTHCWVLRMWLARDANDAGAACVEICGKKGAAWLGDARASWALAELSTLCSVCFAVTQRRALEGSLLASYRSGCLSEDDYGISRSRKKAAAAAACLAAAAGREGPLTGEETDSEDNVAVSAGEKVAQRRLHPCRRRRRHLLRQSSSSLRRVASSPPVSSSGGGVHVGGEDFGSSGSTQSVQRIEAGLWRCDAAVGAWKLRRRRRAAAAAAAAAAARRLRRKQQNAAGSASGVRPPPPMGDCALDERQEESDASRESLGRSGVLQKDVQAPLQEPEEEASSPTVAFVRAGFVQAADERDPRHPREVPSHSLMLERDSAAALASTLILLPPPERQKIPASPSTSPALPPPIPLSSCSSVAVCALVAATICSPHSLPLLLTNAAP
ncbi:uncharacterized protein LOC113146553 [Cyclospora cayetanensis]|uniref:Uncharacterized protein LOC113146553 n=1 Tax=Cyclospora cayetanensis TaxID=88456 RepID=A0A6P6RR67_9EIME|nr:uncharacterized protein LOC113146553 [Cyclospora cayetanensis]